MRVKSITLGRAWDAMVQPLGAFVRDVTQALNGGLLLRDNGPGIVRSLRWQGTPVTVSTTLTSKPLAVYVLTATGDSAPESNYSGVPVLWVWLNDAAHSIRVDAIGVDPEADIYDVTLWIVGG